MRRDACTEVACALAVVRFYNPCMEQTARERLQAKREWILNQRLDIRLAVILVCVLVCAVWLMLGSDLIRQDLEHWADFRVARWMGVPPAKITCSAYGVWLGLAALLVPTLLLPRWLDHVWRQHYARLSGLLRAFAAGQLLVGGEYWESARELLQGKPWLRFISMPHAGNLERQLELNAWHWRAVSVMAHGRRGLEDALVLGGLAWLWRRPLTAVYTYKIAWVLLAFSLALYGGWDFWPFLFMVQCALTGVFILLTGGYVQNRAAQVAMIDLLLE
jgi:hypothetical protein